jgi:hypothetical protein
MAPKKQSKLSTMASKEMSKFNTSLLSGILNFTEIGQSLHCSTEESVSHSVNVARPFLYNQKFTKQLWQKKSYGNSEKN